MPWKRYNYGYGDEPTPGWRSMGCDCCSRTLGFDKSEDALYDLISISDMEKIVSDLKTQLLLAETDLELMRNEAQNKPQGDK